MHWREIRGSVIDDGAEVLVCTNNVTGPTGPTMGKGVALDFARRWPEIVPGYKEECISGRLNVGRCLLYPLPQPSTPDFFAPAPAKMWGAFCTKLDWRDKSRLEWIRTGLRDLVAEMHRHRMKSVAIPPLGCGHGGLNWQDVEPMIREAFQDTSYDVRVYIPH